MTQPRSYFFAVAATVMRRVLVDRARARQSEKRGGGWARVDALEGAPSLADDPERLLCVDEALSRLAKLDPRKRSTTKDTADTKGTSGIQA